MTTPKPATHSRGDDAKVTAYDLYVLIETARDTLQFAGEGRVFSFLRQERERVITKCAEYLNQKDVSP